MPAKFVVEYTPLATFAVQVAAVAAAGTGYDVVEFADVHQAFSFWY